LQLDRSARGRPQITDAGGEGIESMQRFAKRIERQRLYVIFESARATSTLEQANAPSWLGSSTAVRPEQQVLGTIAACRHGCVPRVQRAHAGNLECHPQLQ